MQKVGHHNPPTSLTTDGALKVAPDPAAEVQEEVMAYHPVEIFSDAWDAPASGTDITAGTLIEQLGLEKHNNDALLRVAVPCAEGHHRCLDIDSIGFGATETADGSPVLEITTERWDSGFPVIRGTTVAVA